MLASQGLDDGQSEEWLPLAEASRRLGVSVDALRKKVRREQIPARRGNDGRVRVLVSRLADVRTNGHTSQAPGDGRTPASQALNSGQPTASQWRDLEEAREAVEHWGRAAEKAREEAAALRGELAGLRETLARADAERDRALAQAERLTAELALARTGWLERLLAAIRRRG
jgi:hypothetical protein